jgi:hypothetical protein
MDFRKVGNVFHYYIQGEVETCVACRKPLEYSQPDARSQNHKCSARAEGSRKAANTRGHDTVARSQTFHERISQGFYLQSLANDDPEE